MIIKRIVDGNMMEFELSGEELRFAHEEFEEGYQRLDIIDYLSEHNITVYSEEDIQNVLDYMYSGEDSNICYNSLLEDAVTYVFDLF
jgi:hypothetical protein